MGKGGPARTRRPGASCPCAPPFRTKGRVVSGAMGRGGGMPSRAPLPREWGRVKGGAGWCALAYPLPARTGAARPMGKGGVGWRAFACPLPAHTGRCGQRGRGGAGGVVSSCAPSWEGGGRGEGERVAAACPCTHPFCANGRPAKGEGVGGAEGRDSGVPSCPLVLCEWEGRRRGERERWAVRTGGREN
ncbi:hypothetical protein EDB84DRAFT_1519213, partial [Lactarius hengduanensis]